MLVSEIFNDLRKNELSDQQKTTWSDADLIIKLNEAVGLVALVRPSVTAKIVTATLVDGALQEIPDDGLRFIKLLNNVRSDGALGRAISYFDVRMLNNAKPDWQRIPASTQIHEYGFDEALERNFYVYPSAIAGMQVQLVYSAQPVAVTDIADTFPLADIYIRPVKEFMLSLLFSGDNSSGINTGDQHSAKAMSLLSVKAQVDQAVRPKPTVQGD